MLNMLNSMYYNVGSIFIALLIGIYRTVANTYDLMITFTQSSSLFDFSKLSNAVKGFSDSIYTLIAVFMLFRITITMIEYLIDPDKLTDKSTGTGKLITRVIISIILVISFNDFIMPKVYELQDALLSPNSIIFKFFDTQSSGGSSNGNTNANTSLGTTKYDSAAECNKNCNGTCNGSVCSINKTNTALGTTKYDSASECNKNCNGTCKDNVCNTILSDTNKCVEEISKTNSPDFGARAAIAYGCKYNSSVYNKLKYSYQNSGDIICKGPCDSNSYIISSDYEDARNQNDNWTLTVTTSSSYSSAVNAMQNVNYDKDYYNNITVEKGENTDGFEFARRIVASFSDDPQVIYENEFLTNPEGNKTVARLVEEGDLNVDLFLAIICGIVVFVVILVLCIEVIIRNLKMIVLELVAPVAFISYMNPNDKVLNNWFQKFVGCYLDLFIKILAIRMAIYFISLLSDSVSGITTILVYIAIFLFAKTVPNLISDLFGIKNMGGTFKDSMNSIKTAALYGTSMAGGAIGGVAALAGGATLGQAGKVFTSGFSGKPGNVNKAYGTARGAVQKRKASGTSWTDAQKAEFPWHRGLEQVEEAKKSAGANYKSLDGALEVSVFSADKSMQQLQNLYDNGTFEEKFKYADAFGVKDMNAFNNASTGEKLKMLDEAWGDKKGLEMARVLIDSQNAVKSGNANAFQQTVVNLAQKVDLSEKNVGVNISGVSKAKTVDEALVSLKIAKEHSKSGYRADQLTPTEQKQAQKKQNNTNNP